MGIYPQIHYQRLYNRTVAQVHAQLDEDTFQSACKAGGKLSYDQVIAFVLEDEASPMALHERRKPRAVEGLHLMAVHLQSGTLFALK